MLNETQQQRDERFMREALKEADGPVVSKTSGFYEVVQHARIKVVLTSPDVEILEGEDEQIWYGKYLTFDFAFEIPFDFAKKQILSAQKIDFVYFNIKFKFFFE